MTENRLDSRQSRQRELLDQMTSVTDSPVNNLLRGTNKEITPSLRMRVVSATTLDIDTHLVTNPETHRSHTIAPPNGSFIAPTYPVTVIIPGSNGGSITNSTGSSPVVLSISGTNYRLVGLAINNVGSLSVTLGAEMASLVSPLSYPIFPNGYFAIGMFGVQGNGGGGFNALLDDNVQQFNGGIAAAILNPMTSPGDIIFGGTLGSPLNLPILTGGSPTPGNNGALLEVTSAGIPGWTNTIHNNKTFDSAVAVQGILKVGNPNTRAEQFSVLSAASGYAAWVENTSASTGANGLSVKTAATDASSFVQQWVTSSVVGEVLATGTWHIGSSGGSRTHIVNGSLNVTETITAGTGLTVTSGQIVLPTGSASAPSLAFTGALGLGIYAPSLSGLGFAVGGVFRAELTATGLNVVNSITAGTGLTVTSGVTSITGILDVNSTIINLVANSILPSPFIINGTTSSVTGGAGVIISGTATNPGNNGIFLEGVGGSGAADILVSGDTTFQDSVTISSSLIVNSTSTFNNLITANNGISVNGDVLLVTATAEFTVNAGAIVTLSPPGGTPVYASGDRFLYINSSNQLRYSTTSF